MSTTVADTPWSKDGTVGLEVADGVATVTLNRPPGNAWTPALGERYFEIIDELALDTRVRAIVVTGAGADFCVGADGGGLEKVADQGSYQIGADRPTYWRTMEVGKPVIAAINGACFGIGLALGLLCDVRFVSSSAKFSTSFVRRGLTAELGMPWLLPRIVGVGAAADLLLSGRVVRAPEALSLGLANRVVDPEELVANAQSYAAELAEKCSPAAMAVVKRQLYADLTSSLPSAVGRGDRYMESAMASEDFAEGVRSWQERRLPEFPPLDPALATFELPDDGAEDEA